MACQYCVPFMRDPFDVFSQCPDMPSDDELSSVYLRFMSPHGCAPNGWWELLAVRKTYRNKSVTLLKVNNCPMCGRELPRRME